MLARWGLVERRCVCVVGFGELGGDRRPGAASSSGVRETVGWFRRSDFGCSGAGALVMYPMGVHTRV